MKAGNLSSSCKKWKVKLFCDKIVRKKARTVQSVVLAVSLAKEIHFFIGFSDTLFDGISAESWIVRGIKHILHAFLFTYDGLR